MRSDFWRRWSLVPRGVLVLVEKAEQAMLVPHARTARPGGM